MQQVYKILYKRVTEYSTYECGAMCEGESWSTEYEVVPFDMQKEEQIFNECDYGYEEYVLVTDYPTKNEIEEYIREGLLQIQNNEQYDDMGNDYD